MLIAAVTVMLIVCVAVDASNDTVTINSTFDPNENVTVNDSYVLQPNDAGKAKLQGVVVEKEKVVKKVTKVPLITITAKPSCGCHYSYTWHTMTYVNYCPYCNKYGVLTNLHKPQAKYEQEISCKICSSDWCGCCGKEKYSWSHKYLRRI